MNIEVNNSSKTKTLELAVSPLSTLVNKNRNKELKSLEKEQRFFKDVFPKIFTEVKKSKKIQENPVYLVGKKIKGISLSALSYNNYMTNYKNLLKYPSNYYYSTERLKNYIPFKMLDNANLNNKKNFYSTYNDFNNRVLAFNSESNNNANNKSVLNYKKFIFKTNYSNKDVWNYSEKINFQNNDNEILKYFLEGVFLIEPNKIKWLKIDEKKIHPHILNKEDFNFYSKYLENLPKNENFTDTKTKEYELSLFKNNKLKFILELKSICLCFEEIDINNINYNSINNNINNNNNKEKKKNVQKIYLPFKYLALFFLLSYSSLKVFISEIITYEIENNKFYIKVNEKLEKVVKKYTEYCQYKINLFTSENNESAFDDIIYYQNEFHYNYIFPWIIYDNRYRDIKTKCFKLKIIPPIISFQPEDYGLKFQKFSNKWLILELIKNNFIFWDRYLLYNLFMNKKFRNTISYILNKKRNYISYEYTIKTIGTAIDDKIAKKNNFDFFITVALDNKNHYYYFSPFKASISSKKHGKYNLNDSICLKLNDSRKMYKLMNYFGIITTFNKFMFYNKLTKKYYFGFKFLKEITQDYFSLLKGDIITECFINKNYKQVFRFNGVEYHLFIRECLFCEKIINVYNYSELKYYKIPNELLVYVFENEIYKDDIFSIFINKANKFIDLKEIEEYKEFFLKRNIYDSSSNVSKTSKDKNKKKGKNSSNASLKFNESKKSSDKNKLIELKKTNNLKSEDDIIKRIRDRKSMNTLVTRKLSDLNKNSSFKKQFISKKSTLFLGKRSEDIKTRISSKFFDSTKNKDDYKIKIENLYKQGEFENFGENKNNNMDLKNISNARQLSLMKIKSGYIKENYNDDIEKLKFNLNSKNFINK